MALGKEGSNDNKGELLATPHDILQLEDHHDIIPSMITDAFQVNTIYTRHQVAKAVVRTFVELARKDVDGEDLSNILWLDAGAGSGALLQEFPEEFMRIGVDLDPQNEGVSRMDFFKVSRDWLTAATTTCRTTDYRQLCIISNPPFAEGSRGGYTIIGKFLQHAIDLDARCMGLIVPVKFSHVWKSFGLPIQLRYRMNLPKNSFYDPSTATYKNVQCQFLYFDLQPPLLPSETAVVMSRTKSDEETLPPPRIHIVAKRDKGRYPDIATVDVTSAAVKGLAEAGVLLATSMDSAITMTAKLTDKFELFLELNPKRPLSLVNSTSSKVEGHSLGWISTSVKPAVALAMNQLSLQRGDQFGNPRSQPQHTVTVDLMCGEGTLEFESFNSLESQSSFRIVGDKNPEVVYQAADKISSLQNRHLSSRPLLDFVIWDAQNLPLRNGIADSILADLPFTGSSKKVHQEPSTSKSTTINPRKDNQAAADATSNCPSLNYQVVLAETVRVLTPSVGCVVLVSPDTKALAFGCKKFSGSLKESFQTRLNIGGIAGKLCCLLRKDACWKDQNLWVLDATADHSLELYTIAQRACAGYSLNDILDLQATTADSTNKAPKKSSLLSKVYLNDVYHRNNHEISHSYRLCFDPLVNNFQAKTLEKAIRLALEDNPIHGTKLR